MNLLLIVVESNSKLLCELYNYRAYQTLDLKLSRLHLKKINYCCAMVQIIIILLILKILPFKYWTQCIAVHTYNFL